MKFFRSLKARLTLWYVFIVIVLVAFSSTVAYVQLSRGLALKTVYPWDMRTATVEKTENGTVVGEFSDVLQQEGTDKGYKTVDGYDAGDLQRLASEGGVVELGSLDGLIAVDAKTLVDPGLPDDAEVWLYLYGSADKPGVYRLVQVNQTALAMELRLAYFRRAVLITAALTLALSAGLGFFLVWRMLRPLRAITEAARGITGHDLKGRVTVRQGDEVGELALTMNRMFDRVEGALESERQVAADLSHELRTPLAVMQSEATQALKKERGDNAYHKALETVSREVTHVSAVAERLLFLARSEHGGELAKAPVDLSELMTEIGWDAEVLCEEKGITFKSDLADGSDNCVIAGDKTRLRELFLNLVNNAVRYTPAGGMISITLGRTGRESASRDACATESAGRTGGDACATGTGPIAAGATGNGSTGVCAMVAISDTGIGIAEEHLPYIFDRFYRASKGMAPAEDGAGLGLAISKRIAELHGGRIEVTSRVGKGTTFTVVLPVG